MTILPNPFSDGSRAPSENTAAASPVSSQVDAAAEPSRFVLDEEAFLNDLEPLPAFLSAPRHLSATDLMPVLMTLAGR